ncbi:hypothetical protein NSK11_contig00318-0002 [Nocardia seriolae]|uniref:Uncharacterized protein n=1 Tax=Nocardia seriolae TaxID=37332 RepID=A0ABC9Z7G8_9NOCA|nr:hypothetical protein NSER024013_54460 [Nocardia seriolae]GAP33530.1 hypothetical protein NSK11_contig00318-0002 [Nocardia seriolae]
MPQYLPIQGDAPTEFPSPDRTAVTKPGQGNSVEWARGPWNRWRGGTRIIKRPHPVPDVTGTLNRPLRRGLPDRPKNRNRLSIKLIQGANLRMKVRRT